MPSEGKPLKVGFCDSYTYAILAIRDQKFDIAVVSKLGLFKVVLKDDSRKEPLMQDGLRLTAVTGGYTTLVWDGTREDLKAKLTTHFGDFTEAPIRD